MATYSGKKTVTTAGTAVQLVTTSTRCNGPLMVKALTANTGYIYVGTVSGDVASTNGYELDAGEVAPFNYVGDLQSIWIDSSVNGEGVTWIMCNVM